MGAVADLGFIGAPISDPVATARFIGGMILTKRQKAALLKDYVLEAGGTLTPEIVKAAAAYSEAL